MAALTSRKPSVILNHLQRNSFTISVDNISNEVGSVKNVCLCLSFLLFLSTPVCQRSSAWLIALAVSTVLPCHVHPTDSARSLHRPGVAHQTSLRSLLTMMSSSNSPPRGGGSPIQGFDHCYAGSCYRAGIPAWAPPYFCRNCPR